LIPSIEGRERQSYLIIAVQFSYISVNVIHRTRIYCKMYQRKRCISTIRSGQLETFLLKPQGDLFFHFSAPEADNLYFCLSTSNGNYIPPLQMEKKVAKLYLIHFCFYILNKTGSFRFSILYYGFLKQSVAESLFMNEIKFIHMSLKHGGSKISFNSKDNFQRKIKKS